MGWDGKNIAGLNYPDCRGMVSQILEVVGQMPVRPTLGLVCDPGEPASSYVDACAELEPHADVLIRPFDSSGMLNDDGSFRYDVKSYRQRAIEYATTLGKYATYMECGNEITLPSSFVGQNIVIMTQAAIAVANAHNLKTVVTYFFDGDSPMTMGEMASDWKIKSDIAGLSVYPRTYQAKWVSLDYAVNTLDAALIGMGIPIAILEFGSEDANGNFQVSEAAHQALVTEFLTWRPQIKTQYLVGGFEWDGPTWLPGDISLYQRLFSP